MSNISILGLGNYARAIESGNAAREHMDELQQLPPAFRKAVLVAQLRSITTEDLTT